jgi:hypothetical protein
MTKHTTKMSVYLLLASSNLFVAFFLISTNKLPTNEEARGIAAGVLHWCSGEFGPANDSPPLARMVGVMPLLPLGFKYEKGKMNEKNPDHQLGARDQELTYAGRFAHLNGSFNFFYLPRIMCFLWWLAGAWVIVRWCSRLYGGMAGFLGLVFWAFVPGVLAQEQLATPEMPAAVACVGATYTFRGYLVARSWGRAALSGLLLAVAQLVEFVLLTLLLLWPLLAAIHRLSEGNKAVSEMTARTRILQTAAAITLSVCVVNLGYGFAGSGSSLGSLEFDCDALRGGSRSPDGRASDGLPDNRFRGTWLGRVVVPLPAAYVRGLNRRWHERQTALVRRGEEEWPPGLAGRPHSSVGGKLPIGISVMMLVSLALLVGRHPASAPWSEELTLWVPAALFLAIPTKATGTFSPDLGVLLATPFAIITASKLAFFLRPLRRKATWFVAVLAGLSVGECLKGSLTEYLTIDRAIRFRHDMGRQGRRLGLTFLEPRTSVDIGHGMHGLMYRTFVDSRSTRMDYAIFVPEGYRGDRPYPLILFLHGFGDRGTQDRTDRRYTEVGLPFTLKHRAIDFLVLCPQGRSGYWNPGGDDARGALELLAAVEEEYRVDPKRIFLTGVSSGGSGTWSLAAAFPGRWAAIFPVAGSCDVSEASAVKDIPCWCFHNRYDGDILVEKPRRMIDFLRATGGKPRYTEYLNTTHNAWDKAYVLPELYNWLALQRQP